MEIQQNAQMCIRDRYEVHHKNQRLCDDTYHGKKDSGSQGTICTGKEGIYACLLYTSGVDTSSITKDCTFTVDPYSYEITVDGVDEETKVLMQDTLNVGDNGKNLYKHIYYCSTQDGCESSQITKESKMKYEAYHQVYSYTGYELDKLEEKNGTYYTESGENILDLVDKAVEDSGKVPKEFKQQMKNWIHDLVSTMSTKGWNNVPDMTLSILYGKSGLKDMNQLITYQYEADSTNRQWYSVL